MRGAKPPPSSPSSTPFVRSPVPWISDEIWSSWQTGEPGADRPAFRDPRLYVVTRDDLKRARVATVESGKPIPAWRTFHENLSEIRSLRSSATRILDPSWPMCCGRLATLINEEGSGRSLAAIEAETGKLDLAFMEMEIWHDWIPRNEQEVENVWQTGYRALLEEGRKDNVLGGILLFQCRACGRVYVGSCAV
jgi:hypothetical protein